MLLELSLFGNSLGEAMKVGTLAILLVSLLTIPAVAMAATYYATCECDPGESQSQAVRDILMSWRNSVQNGDVVSILDVRPEQNGQYYFVNYRYNNGSFYAENNGYASPASGGYNPYYGSPWGGAGNPGWHWHYSSTCTVGGVPCDQIAP
jgi:hypothetical protein